MSKKAVAAELNPDYDPPCSQLTYEADIQNVKERIIERQWKSLFKVILQKLLKVWNIRSCIFIFKNLLEQNHVHKICFITSRGYLATQTLLVSCVPTWFLNHESQTTKKTGVCALKWLLNVDKMKNWIRPVLVFLYNYCLTKKLLQLYNCDI